MEEKQTPTERARLTEHYTGQKNWLKWGPYVSERQWGTVREDYSADGSVWDYFVHDHARSRSYRWGEDGIAGISNNHQELCFAWAFWNGNDPILKERLFGLNGKEGNHGEDVKELYYYLDNTPTHSYMKMLYKYPHGAFPYDDLVATNAARSKEEPEYELLDTGIFKENKYFDIFIEYAKASEEDFLIKLTVHNRASQAAALDVLPTLWFRNRWDFGLVDSKPSISLVEENSTCQSIHAAHQRLGEYYLYFQTADQLLFTENETNKEKLFNSPNKSVFVKDSFHDAVVKNNYSLFSGKKEGTKCSPLYQMTIEGGASKEIILRFTNHKLDDPLGEEFHSVFENRVKEADQFYAALHGQVLSDDLKNIQRQAFAGMLWNKQYYNLDVERWLNGDPGLPPPPESRKTGRNHSWQYLNNADIISMPDKWEYPWYASWDLAFHCVTFARLDAEFAKNQLIMIFREWYMNPNGQIPAYEWAFSDVNPPVHAWAALKVYAIDKLHTGKGDITFLKKMFHKLLLNFTWWVNRKDEEGNNLFEGGFLGLDNIGVFDRSKQLTKDGILSQVDGTCWMGMFALNMLEIAMVITEEDPSYEDVCTKFFEHFVYIAESLNQYGVDKAGLWNEQDGIFYDKLTRSDGKSFEVKVKSLVGLTSLFATSYIPFDKMDKFKNFRRNIEWFYNFRKDNHKYLPYEEHKENHHVLLSIVNQERFARMLKLMLSESEFLSGSGIRSVSRYHKDNNYELDIDGQKFPMSYEPGESTTTMFGGNSNWRGPVWMPVNYLLIESLYKYYDYYQDNFKVEYPTGSGAFLNLKQVAEELSKRLIGIFQKDEKGIRKVHGEYAVYATDEHFKDLILFYEYFHGENGRGIGASHQTGWTGVVADMIHQVYSSGH
ncbi:MAG: glucosidase [Chitinophagaceae bacterium]|nr:glucosidase [Chitinophagaceae bacterium]